MLKVETVAGLTLALIVGVIAGALGLALYLSGVGGSFGVILALIFSGIIILIQWGIGPWVVKLISRAKPLKREQAPKIYAMLERLSMKAGLPKPPRLFVVNNRTPNAFAFGRTRSDANIALHTGLIEVLSPEELESVLAHELGHITHRDFIVMTVASIIPILFYYLAIIALSSLGGGGGSRDRNRPNFLAVFVGGLLARLLGHVLVMWLSRVREFYADSFSARLTSAKTLSKALVKISWGLVDKRGMNEALSCMYVGDVTGENAQRLAGFLEMDAENLEEAMTREKKRSFLEVFMTHPLTSKRILALKRIEEA